MKKMDVSFLWRSEPEFALERVVLGTGEATSAEFALSGADPTDDLRCLIALVRLYLTREIRELPIDALDLSTLTPFQRRVLLTLGEKVPYGSTVSYGELASLAGAPNAARAVGTALRSNQFPLFLPCHRVIRSDGSIGGFQGGSESGVRLKRFLLDFEST